MWPCVLQVGTNQCWEYQWYMYHWYKKVSSIKYHYTFFKKYHYPYQWYIWDVSVTTDTCQMIHFFNFKQSPMLGDAFLDTCVRQQILQNLRNPNWNACMSMCLSCSLSQLHLTNCRVRRQLTLAISYQPCTCCRQNAQYAETLWATCSCNAGRLRQENSCYLASLFQAKVTDDKKERCRELFIQACRQYEPVLDSSEASQSRYLMMWTIS